MSPSVGHKSSPTRAWRSPPRRSPKHNRERSPTRHRSSHRSPIKEKENPSSSRGRSPKRPRSRSPIPHAKRGNDEDHERQRSREQHKERHRERGVDREVLVDQSERSRSPVLHTKHRSEEEHELRRSREHHKERHRERGIDKEVSIDRSERKSVREKKDEGSLNSRSRHKRSESPVDVDRSIGRNSGSPSRVSRSRMRNEVASPRGDDNREENDSVAIMKATEEALEAKKKEQPSYELSGKLAAETNRVRGVTLLHTEPSEARKPDIRWRLYVFKGGEALNEPLYIHRQSCYLFGRERRVADVPTDHPSCSKQHAVIQFRQVEKEKPDGMLSKQVRPYLMDLGSTNGTFLNETRIEPERYYELFEKDTIKFGNSSREYVILHENSA